MKYFRSALFCVSWLGAGSLAGAFPERPNILLILVDDLGKDWISCYGADDIETPRIDQLASSGLRFNHAYSMPQCTPTRATLLTGQYPWRTGWVNHWDVPRWGIAYFDWEKYTTFARLLKQVGYKTAVAGKWQINDFRLEPRALEKHGFDDWCVWTGYEGQNPPSGKRYQDVYVHTRKGSRTRVGEFGPDVYCDFLIDFMKHHREEPQLLYFPMALTHGPLVPTPREPNASGKRDRHKAMVRYTDHLVGRLVDALETLDLRQSTLVFFTTDNGTGRGQLGRVAGQRPSGGKATLFEGGVCQPFVVNCPGAVGKGVTDALVDFTDMLPTFADLAGAPLKPGVELDGRSFAPLLRGQAADSPRQWILSMGFGKARLTAAGVEGREAYTPRIIRGKRFKAWVGADGNVEAFYDLEQDPLEKNNRVSDDSPEVQSARARLQAIVRTMPMRDARPRYRKRPRNPWDHAVTATGRPAASSAR
jgi:arylsulfatase A-like enzyme